MADQPIMELKGSKLRNNEWRPNRVLVFEDRVEELKPSLLKTTHQTVRYEQVAQVAMNTGVAYADLVIESTGGGVIHAKGLAKAEAERAKQLIDERIARIRSTPAAAAAPSSLADELAKLAGLRDQGVLTEAEFEAEKAKLLAR